MSSIILFAIASSVVSDAASKMEVHAPSGRVQLAAGADDATMQAVPDETRTLFILSAKHISPKGFEQLSRLIHLEFLRVNHTKHGDAVFTAIANHPTINHLKMWSDERVSAAGLRHLSTAKSLRSLDLTGVPLDGDTISAMPAQLESLTLNGCHLRDIELSKLPALPHLRGLSLLRNEQVTEVGLIALLERQPNMERLAVDIASDEFLRSLAQQNKLKTLWLRRQPFTRAGLRLISQLDLLERLAVSFPLTDELRNEIQCLPNPLLKHVTHQGKYIYLNRR